MNNLAFHFILVNYILGFYKYEKTENLLCNTPSKVRNKVNKAPALLNISITEKRSVDNVGTIE